VIGMAHRQLKSLGLISCTSEKQDYACKASEMYLPSNLFSKAFPYAKKHYDIVSILSAKYGFLSLDDRVEPYDESLNGKGVAEIKAWSDRVFGQMNSRLDLKAIRVAYFHAGDRYRKYLIPKFEGVGIKCEVPLQGLRIGEQLRWYDRHDC
jgi:hypothetical protein